MSLKKIHQATGILFITGTIPEIFPCTSLMMNFDYPDILRFSEREIWKKKPLASYHGTVPG
jgi:hypothetical protein